MKALTLVSCAATLAIAAVAHAAVSPSRTFVARLEKAGRAEASFSRTTTDPFTSKPVTTRGQLALEPPDRMSLSFPATGERIVVRAEGGEWLQPPLRQMMTLDPGHAATARRWWRILLAGDSNVTVRLVSGRRWRVTRSDAAEGEPGSAFVTFDAAGMPTRLEIEEYGAPTTYRLSGWRFVAPRGQAAFTIQAPSGYEVVPLP